MPLFYLDTSALLKAYVAERGSEVVADLIASERVVISMLCLPEVASALQRRVREGALTTRDRDEIFDVFSTHASYLQAVSITDGILHDAATILRLPPLEALRTLDAIHLACARESFILANRALGLEGVVVTADKRLVTAATALGLRAMNPEERA